MAKKKIKIDMGFVLYDVLYENGTRSSRRRVPNDELGIDHSDARARTHIMAQDRKIAEMSGQSRGPIASLSRSPGQ